jgi:hypothetical protein
MILETALISAVAPAAIDAVKTLFGGVSRKLGGMSVDDEIKLANTDIDRLKALAELDRPEGAPSQWVVDLRASFRYIASGLMVLGGLAMAGYGVVQAQAGAIEIGAALASAPMSFIIGERFLLKFKK